MGYINYTCKYTGGRAARRSNREISRYVLATRTPRRRSAPSVPGPSLAASPLSRPSPRRSTHRLTHLRARGEYLCPHLHRNVAYPAASSCAAPANSYAFFELPVKSLTRPPFTRRPFPHRKNARGMKLRRPPRLFRGFWCTAACRDNESQARTRGSAGFRMTRTRLAPQSCPTLRPC